MIPTGQDSLNTRSALTVGSQQFAYYSLAKAGEALGDISRLPFSMKVLLENLLRFEDGVTVTRDDLQAMVDWQKERRISREIQYRPARVLMQDFTGVPAVVDLAAMRDAMKQLGGDPQKINPQVPVHLVIDHSVMVDEFGTPKSFGDNVALEYQRNAERYEFLKWGASAFDNFQVVPPGTGICHQVNLEYIAQCVWSSDDQTGETVAYPDTLVGTDSHTTMVNGLGVLGWGVGGIEAEAAMLAQPVIDADPRSGRLPPGGRAEGRHHRHRPGADRDPDAARQGRRREVRRILRPRPRRAEPRRPRDHRQHGARIWRDLRLLPDRRADHRISRADRPRARADRIWSGPIARRRACGATPRAPEPVFTDTLDLDMSSVEPSLAGPRRPQDRVLLTEVDDQFNAELETTYNKANDPRVPVEGEDYDLGNGDVVIAAITSCTNTSNPSVLVAAGLVARKARALGLDRKPWVKTSLAPGSKVVTDYLEASGLSRRSRRDRLQPGRLWLHHLHRQFGTARRRRFRRRSPTRIWSRRSVLSGNRNFEGRVSPDCRANYLASPPLVVAYALKGTVRSDMVNEPIGTGRNGQPVYLRDIWPTNEEVRALIDAHVHSHMFRTRYADVYAGDERWQAIEITGGDTYSWPAASTYIQNPPYFTGMTMTPVPLKDVVEARALAVFGNSITTDHISPAGAIKLDSPAGSYLIGKGVAAARVQQLWRAPRQS